MKKETLEEAIIRLTSDEDDVSKRLSGAYYITKGAKWQQERSYSDEDMDNYAEYCTNHVLTSKTGHPYLYVKEWFEQFSKLKNG